MAVRKTLAAVDQDFSEIDRLIRDARRRLAVAAETVRIAAEEKANTKKAAKAKRRARR